MKVFVVDLGSQWGHLIYRRLRDLDVETKMVPADSPLSDVETVDGLVFSGGALRVGKGETEMAGNCGLFLDSAVERGTPVLGVCAGQQFIALRFGGEVRPAKVPEYGNVELVVDYANDLFQGLPEKFTVFASHNDEVVKAPGFKTLRTARMLRFTLSSTKARRYTERFSIPRLRIRNMEPRFTKTFCACASARKRAFCSNARRAKGVRTALAAFLFLPAKPGAEASCFPVFLSSVCAPKARRSSLPCRR